MVFTGQILTELTRRQLRERERNQGVSEAPIEESPQFSIAEPVAVINSDYQSPLPTRRQLRERAASSLPEAPASAANAAASREPVEIGGPLEGEFELDSDSTKSTAVAFESGRLSPRPAPLPPIGLRRELRQPANDIEHEKPAAMSSIEAEIPEQGFRGANYLGEPSTQSIMLEIAPEAISLPLDTGEVFSTGSISILSESTGSITGALDGIDLDREDAVTGVISIFDPVSARDLIDERSPLGVVPSGVLLKGWWRPWAVGLFSFAMAIAAILASITIFNALGA